MAAIAAEKAAKASIPKPKAVKCQPRRKERHKKRLAAESQRLELETEKSCKAARKAAELLHDRLGKDLPALVQLLNETDLRRLQWEIERLVSGGESRA